jgi:hypothetical protein
VYPLSREPVLMTLQPWGSIVSAISSAYSSMLGYSIIQNELSKREEMYILKVFLHMILWYSTQIRFPNFPCTSVIKL